MSPSEGTQVIKRIRRVLEIVWMLQGRKSLNKFALAELYDVSDRTIKRDMELLQEAEVPVSRKGSVYTLEADQLQFPQLSREELIALMVGAQFPLPRRLQQSREVAISKLLSAASADDRRHVQIVQDRLQQWQSQHHLAQPDFLEEQILAELLETMEENAPKSPQELGAPRYDSNAK